MTNKFESSRGLSFTHEEMEDLPLFNSEEESFEAWLEYENEHGISPDEVQTYMNKYEEEQERLNEPESDIMIDGYGRPYEQFKLDLTDDDLEDLNTSSKNIER